jgi:maltose O-acetyltransferase
LEARNKGASISIGNGTWINNDFRAIAEHTFISIGENCRIGGRVEMLDSDFHGLCVDQRDMSKAEWAAPVIVGNDVFIGSNVAILKGVRIGDGAVIAAGSIVTRDIPSRVVAAGNPARVVSSLNGQEN